MIESKAAPGVALLFADADLGAHLREALVALGARIVYEGAAAQVQADTLHERGADVVVINLEPAEDEHFDRLCAILDQDSQRVVFNDAEVSRDLSGWDKARWARHLAVKVLGNGDVDPPRPADTRQVERVDAELETGGGQPDAPDEVDGVTAAGSDMTTDMDSTLSIEDEHAASEALSAELEAMLAKEDNGGAALSGADAEASVVPAVQVEQRQAESTLAPATEWQLEDVDATPPAPAEREDASQFGVEKMQAADYLKPEAEGGQQASLIEPGLKLELVSLEESIAPSMVDKTISEMVLDDNAGVVRRVVLVGAGRGTTVELGEFLAGLPDTLPTLVLIVQHQRDQQPEAVAAALDTSTRLPVKVIADDALARHGQAWLLPAGQRCQVARSGRLSLSASEAEAHGDPSIDQCLDALVDAFGADTMAIVLAGDGEDALAGARKVVGCGGRVWVQDVAGSSSTAMAARIRKEGLAAFIGSPTDLARHLVEAYT